jgi:hypothetical protein
MAVDSFVLRGIMHAAHGVAAARDDLRIVVGAE